MDDRASGTKEQHSSVRYKCIISDLSTTLKIAANALGVSIATSPADVADPLEPASLFTAHPVPRQCDLGMGETSLLHVQWQLPLPTATRERNHRGQDQLHLYY